jgi:hypothetical protein
MTLEHVVLGEGLAARVALEVAVLQVDGQDVALQHVVLRESLGPTL